MNESTEDVKIEAEQSTTIQSETNIIKEKTDQTPKSWRSRMKDIRGKNKLALLFKSRRSKILLVLCIVLVAFFIVDPLNIRKGTLKLGFNLPQNVTQINMAGFKVFVDGQQLVLNSDGKFTGLVFAGNKEISLKSPFYKDVKKNVYIAINAETNAVMDLEVAKEFEMELFELESGSRISNYEITYEGTKTSAVDGKATVSDIPANTRNFSIQIIAKDFPEKSLNISNFESTEFPRRINISKSSQKISRTDYKKDFSYSYVSEVDGLNGTFFPGNTILLEDGSAASFTVFNNSNYNVQSTSVKSIVTDISTDTVTSAKTYDKQNADLALKSAFFQDSSNEVLFLEAPTSYSSSYNNKKINSLVKYIYSWNFQTGVIKPLSKMAYYPGEDRLRKSNGTTIKLGQTNAVFTYGGYQQQTTGNPLTMVQSKNKRYVYFTQANEDSTENGIYSIDDLNGGKHTRIYSVAGDEYIGVLGVSDDNNIVTFWIKDHNQETSVWQYRYDNNSFKKYVVNGDEFFWLIYDYSNQSFVSPDGKKVFISGADKNISILDTANGSIKDYPVLTEPLGAIKWVNNEQIKIQMGKESVKDSYILTLASGVFANINY